MFVINSQRQEFESWMDNAAIKEPEKTNFYNWIIKSPVDIFIPKIPPVGCLTKGVDFYPRGFVFDILVNINGIDWFNYSNERYSYISLDSEVNNWLDWIEKIPSKNFLIDEREDYYNFPSHFPEDDYQHYIDTFKAFKKVSVVVVEEYWKTKELEKNFSALK